MYGRAAEALEARWQLEETDREQGFPLNNQQHSTSHETLQCISLQPPPLLIQT